MMVNPSLKVASQCSKNKNETMVSPSRYIFFDCHLYSRRLLDHLKHMYGIALVQLTLPTVIWQRRANLITLTTLPVSIQWCSQRWRYDQKLEMFNPGNTGNTFITYVTKDCSNFWRTENEQYYRKSIIAIPSMHAVLPTHWYYIKNSFASLQRDPRVFGWQNSFTTQSAICNLIMINYVRPL